MLLMDYHFSDQIIRWRQLDYLISLTLLTVRNDKPCHNKKIRKKLESIKLPMIKIQWL